VAEEAPAGKLEPLLADWARFIVRHKGKVVILGGAFFVLSVIGFPRLVVETNTLRFFKPQSEIRKTTEVINDNFGGSENLSILIQGDIKRPDALNQILDIQQYAENLKHVGYSVSIGDYVAEINKALNENNPAFRQIPDTREAVAQEILLYEMSGDPSDFKNVVDYDYREANVTVRMESISSRELGEVVEKIEAYAKSKTEAGITANVTGSSYLFKVLTDLLVKGQILNIISSLAAVWLIVALIFRSVGAGGYSIIPLSLTIGLNFGLMGWLNIPLDTATTMLASMAIGIGIDYSIHFLSRYRLEVQRTRDYAIAAIETTRSSGKAILYNAAAVTMGFIVLLFSSFRPIQVLGALTALTMVTSALGALSVLPAVLNIVKPKFLLKSASK
jgi:predicted RND superfamily exporter protein